MLNAELCKAIESLDDFRFGFPFCIGLDRVALHFT
jgi:hypothetical protein